MYMHFILFQHPDHKQTLPSTRPPKQLSQTDIDAIVSRITVIELDLLSADLPICESAYSAIMMLVLLSILPLIINLPHIPNYMNKSTRKRSRLLRRASPWRFNNKKKQLQTPADVTTTTHARSQTTSHVTSTIKQVIIFFTVLIFRIITSPVVMGGGLTHKDYE